MAKGLFNIVSPGLTYLQRKTYPHDATSFSLDPNLASAPIEGEWLALADGQILERPDFSAEISVAFPLLVDKGRSDVQSSQRLTVAVHPGAIALTSVFATLQKGGAAITYAIGDLLGLCSFVDADGNARLGLYAIGQDGGTPGTPVAGGAAGEIIEVNRVTTTESDNAFAKVLRPPFNPSGLGVSAGTAFPSSAQVLEIQLL